MIFFHVFSFRDNEGDDVPVHDHQKAAGMSRMMSNRGDPTASPARKGSLGKLTIRPVKPDATGSGSGPPPPVSRPVSEVCPSGHMMPGPAEKGQSQEGVAPVDAVTGAEKGNKTTLKIHLVDGGFNVVKCSETTDVKVS